METQLREAKVGEDEWFVAARFRFRPATEMARSAIRSCSRGPRDAAIELPTPVGVPQSAGDHAAR